VAVEGPTEAASRREPTLVWKEISVESVMTPLREILYAKAHEAWFEARRLSPAKRAMPGFIVIGAQKSGTSSLFAYLGQHPLIIRPIFKEPYYFDRHYHRGLGWYGRNFPAQSTVERLNDRYGRAHLTFEATPSYVFDPEVPARIARDVATRKLILLLRDPVDRAISAYWHMCRLGLETRSLEAALKIDLDRYRAEKAFEDGHGPKPSEPPPRPTYLRRGIYHEALARWRRSFAQHELLVIQSEEMFADPASAVRKVFAFLELPPVEHIDFSPQNVGTYAESDGEARQFLGDFYRPHNETLGELTGRRFNWRGTDRN
jgi:hypothetical protein